jgi:acyl-CoA reductase-like NAD-dependent aldehyde dehydrogenase
MRIAQEEIFGPVISAIPFTDIEEVIARANDSDYGLGGTIWAKDLDRALRVAARIESGIVWINRFLSMAPDIPYGGFKQSGIGLELCREGLAAYSQSKIINMQK